MEYQTKSFCTLSPQAGKMRVQFVGLKCPVCGKNLIKVRAGNAGTYRIRALPPAESERAAASVKCPCHGGPVPIVIEADR